jgi:hypothetical protein
MAHNSSIPLFDVKSREGHGNRYLISDLLSYKRTERQQSSTLVWLARDVLERSCFANINREQNQLLCRRVIWRDHPTVIAEFRLVYDMSVVEVISDFLV